VVLRNRLVTISAAVLLSIGSLALAVAPALASNYKGDFTGTGVNIRQGPSTSYKANGEGYPGQDQCTNFFTTGQNIDGNTLWSHLIDIRTGVTGYSSDVYLDYFTPFPVSCTY